MSSSAITGPIFSDVRRSPSGSAAAPSWAFNESTGTGIYLVSAGVLGLSTAGVQRVVVTADGNLLVGTATDSGYRATFGVPSSVGGTTGNAILLRNPGRGGANIAGINDNNLVLTQIDFTSEDKGINTFDDGVIRFSTRYDAVAGGALTERARIDASGTLSVNGGFQATSNGTTTIKRVDVTSGSGADGLVYRDGSNDICGSVQINATANSVTYVNSSDERLKTNPESFDGLVLVQQMLPKRYERLCNLGVKEIGLYAQELYFIMPEAVGVGGDDPQERPWGIDYGRITPVLVKAIQEQQEIIGKLEARLAALEAK